MNSSMEKVVATSTHAELAAGIAELPERLTMAAGALFTLNPPRTKNLAMETQNLQTASAYINNLLLSRGLLRNGKPIEFAKPSKADEGKTATMARIINLVHDLILRRDREAEHRESLASSLRNLRASETRQNLDISRLEAKNAELNRQLALAAGQERAIRITLRTTENSARSLREETLRLRTMVQQVRSQCANDIRKRDLEIRRLKEHLHGQQRGKREGLGMSTIVIKPTPTHASNKAGEVAGGEDLDSPNYSLRQETTEFLTQLSQGLSDENDNLIGLVRSTIATLRNLQGLSAKSSTNSQAQYQDGSRQAEMAADETSEQSALLALPTSYDTLSADMDLVLEHLRELLTNPSFVPIEEVEVREDEIGRLREGWEKMEGRWRQAVAMMDSWKNRMVNDGDTISLEDLKMGLGLGSGLDGAAPDTQGNAVPADENADLSEEDEVQEEPSVDEEDSSAHSDSFEAETSREHLKRNFNEMSGDNEPEEHTCGVEHHQDNTALGEATGNARPTASPRKVSFTGIPEESVGDLDEVALLPNSTSDLPSPSSSFKRYRSKIPRQTTKSTASQATIQQKLDEVQLEAEAAQRTRPWADATGSRKSAVKKVGGRARRRKSTLSPEELAMLMGIE